jgi:hypothetical protein
LLLNGSAQLVRSRGSTWWCFGNETDEQLGCDGCLVTSSVDKRLIQTGPLKSGVSGTEATNRKFTKALDNSDVLSELHWIAEILREMIVMFQAFRCLLTNLMDASVCSA